MQRRERFRESASDASQRKSKRGTRYQHRTYVEYKRFPEPADTST
jgi:hypothetical protein